MNHCIYYTLILRSDVLDFARVETEEQNDKVASALRNTEKARGSKLVLLLFLTRCSFIVI